MRYSSVLTVVLALFGLHWTSAFGGKGILPLEPCPTYVKDAIKKTNEKGCLVVSATLADGTNYACTCVGQSTNSTIMPNELAKLAAKHPVDFKLVEDLTVIKASYGTDPALYICRMGICTWVQY